MCCYFEKGKNSKGRKNSGNNKSKSQTFAIIGLLVYWFIGLLVAKQ